MTYTDCYLLIKKAYATPGKRRLKNGLNLWNIWKNLRKDKLTPYGWSDYQKFFLRQNPNTKDINKLNLNTEYTLYSPTEQ